VNALREISYFYTIVACLKMTDVQIRTNPLKNLKPNKIKPKTTKTMFGSDVFNHFFYSIVRFDLWFVFCQSNQTATL